MAEPTGIMTMRNVRGAGLYPKDRHIMSDKLRSLFSNDWLDGLNDDQIYDLFEQYIELPGLSHIGYEKPIKPRPGTNIYELPIDYEWWLHPSLTEPKPEDEA